jgi:anti-sigma factor ChrR (cupin superfamily)
MNTPPSDDELQTLAALNALGLLDKTEQEAFARLTEADRAAQAWAERHTQTASALLEAARPQAPSPALRERMLALLPNVAATAGIGESELAPGIMIVRNEEKPWQETGIPGIRRKLLHFDPKRKFSSNLVSMKAGSVYPSHWHADLEELFMLSGQVTLSGHKLTAGDYCRAEPGTIHASVIATSDCVFIALASSKNQFLAPASMMVWLGHKLKNWVSRAGQ